MAQLVMEHLPELQVPPAALFAVVQSMHETPQCVLVFSHLLPL